MMMLPPGNVFFTEPDSALMTAFTQSLAEEMIALDFSGKTVRALCAKDVVATVRTALQGEYSNNWRIRFWRALSEAVGHNLYFYRHEPNDSFAPRTYASFEWDASGTNGFIPTGQIMWCNGVLVNDYSLMPEEPKADEIPTAAEPLFNDIEVVQLGTALARRIVELNKEDAFTTEEEWARRDVQVLRLMRTLAKIVANGPQE